MHQTRVVTEGIGVDEDFEGGVIWSFAWISSLSFTDLNSCKVFSCDGKLGTDWLDLTRAPQTILQIQISQRFVLQQRMEF